jgi:phosphomannomutase
VTGEAGGRVRMKGAEMSILMVSVSGVRGVVGETLTPEVITGYTRAFAGIIGAGEVLVARDTRASGGMIEDLVFGTLLSMGREAVRLGIVPTPTAEIMVLHRRAAGAIMISASHNPKQWNALKFIAGDGMFLRQDDVARLKELFGAPAPAADRQSAPQPQTDTTAVAVHIGRLLKLPYIDLDRIKKRRFKVVLDSNHGVAAVMGRPFLEALGCEVVGLGEAADGEFEHPCEPLHENLGALCETVKTRDADLGFAVDPDGDRAAIVSEKGEAIGEEYTLAIAVRTVLERKKGPVTINLSTSKMAEDIAASFGCRCFRTPVGEINVSSEMVRNGSVIGGEGNGGAIIPQVHYCRDAFGGMALALQHLIDTGATVSGSVARLPAYIIRKEKLSIEGLDPDSVLKKIAVRVRGDSVDTQDGLRVAWSDSWVHVRKSNTEPILRIIAEAKNVRRLDELTKSVRALVG